MARNTTSVKLKQVKIVIIKVPGLTSLAEISIQEGYHNIWRFLALVHMISVVS